MKHTPSVFSIEMATHNDAYSVRPEQNINLTLIAPKLRIIYND